MKDDAPRGRWRKGESGNPRGRRPGTGKVMKLREQIAEQVPQIVETLSKAALAGDVQAARVLLERCLPAIKAAEQPVAVPMPAGASLVEQGQAVLQAAAAGDLAPGQAAALLTSLGTLARLVETEELEKRIAALEGAAGGK